MFIFSFTVSYRLFVEAPAAATKSARNFKHRRLLHYIKALAATKTIQLGMGTQHTILWAEDEAFHIHLVREVVKNTGASLFLAEAKNGQEALSFLDDAILLNVLPQIIVLDINMPDFDGRKALVNIITRPELKNIPKVLFSSSSSLLDKLFSARYGVPLVYKSSNAEECKKAIAGILENLLRLQKKEAV